MISDPPADRFRLPPETMAGQRMPNRLQRLGDHVRGGGGLALIGGWMSFAGLHGKALWGYPPLAELIPASVPPRDDRTEVPEGWLPEVRASHPILDGLFGS